ncbi:hypothetical protein EPA93_23160 [Ktedonosporobacter rubrisoli]|uniref:MOSC domain-containing protein n=1 Tax=Ktedonosporobacter rubrisoli TaxID=2509675 RepID=A0A4P6JTS6_KTERU|nr:hypothetical protein [Ktedonosporobacter rubrisoli]QBD78723.1 hypothetical protein EPA93_23160 [Ktedonosporobacter rubrisoli]
MEGYVVSLYIAQEASAPMTSIPVAHLVPGRGIEGDRYYFRNGSRVPEDKGGYEVSLVEQELMTAVRKMLAPQDPGASARRNIVVQGCALHQLAGQTFRIGEVLLRGLTMHDAICSFPQEVQRLACSGLQTGWLGAQILTEGLVYAGDRIERVEALSGRASEQR